MAALAPVLVAVVLWMVTRSAYSLAFAAFGPVLAVAGAVDGRRQRRRARRVALRDALADVEMLGERISRELQRERDRLSALRPTAAELCAGDGRLWLARKDDQAVILSAGCASIAGLVIIDHPDTAQSPAELVTALDALRDSTALVTGVPLLVDARAGMEVVGPDHLARPVARGLALQLAALLPPDAWSLQRSTGEFPAGESWADRLPHSDSRERAESTGPNEFRFVTPDRSIRIGWGRRPVCGGVTITVTARGARLTRDDGQLPVSISVESISAAEASAGAARLFDAASVAGRLPLESSLPDVAEWEQLVDTSNPVEGAAAAGTLAAAIGVGAAGPVWLDLVSDGPHALIAGTTGSGKSELLISWVLSLAHRYPPERVTFLLVDFKGGATFAPLDGLRHVVGTITDLDRRTAGRAIGSLRAETRYRERWLAERCARSIDDPAAIGLPRLVIIIDEFAALVAEYPELHELIADLSSRGRSLGMHLVLCAQRPAGVVRDAVLANAGLRICLRVTSRADSSTVIGDDSAAGLPASPRGRAVVQASGVRRIAQLARSSEADRRRVIEESSVFRSPRRPWVEAPASWVGFSELAGAVGRPLGLLDLPEEQRVEIDGWRPTEDGHLLILGGPRSGLTTALATIHAGSASSGAPPDIWLPPHPADASSALDELARSQVALRGRVAGQTLLIDDLDLLLDRAGDELSAALSGRLATMLRSMTGVRVAASSRRLPGSTLAACFPARLLLGFPSRDQQVMAGGIGNDWVADRRPGSGLWRGSEIQLAADCVAPEATKPVIGRIDPAAALAAGPVAIITTRAPELLSRLGDAGVPCVDVESVAGSRLSARAVTVGDPDAWQSAWALLTEARRASTLLVDRCSTAELRALTRVRDAPPLRSDVAGPLGETGPLANASEAWRVTGREATRVVVEWPNPGL